MHPRLLLLIPTTTYRAEAFVRAARRLPVELSIASEVPSALSHLHPVDLPAFDFDDPAAIAGFVRRFHAEHPIDAVVAVDDQATMAAALVSEALGLAGNTPDATYATINKYRMRHLMTEHDVPTPRYQVVSVDGDVAGAAREIDYPVVLKPLMMAASRGVIRANDEREFVDAFARVASIVSAKGAPRDPQARAHVLVEEYLPGWEIAVEGILTRGHLHVLAVFDKPDPLEGPYFPETIYTTPSRLPESERRAAVEATEATVRALGLRHGPVHAELRGHAGRVRLVEIAARSIGGLCSKVLRFDGDRSLEDVILQHALGFVTTPPPREPLASGVMMLQSVARGRLVEVKGLSAARAVAGVDEVIISARAGRVLDPLPEGFLYLGFIFARGQSPGEVERALRAAHERLDVILAPV
jgi:phosphoribosylaminoimidazole carboxylase (NCAIR synthetase)